MRKVLGLLLLAGVLVIPAQANAQNTDTDQIQALARVVQQLSITGVNDLDFGDVFAGGPAVVVATTDGTAGLFTVAGEVAEDVDVQVTQNPAVLTGGPGPDIAVALVYDTFDGALTVALNPATGSTIAVPAGGSFSVRVGGSITAPGGQASGNYSAPVEVTVTYVNL